MRSFWKFTVMACVLLATLMKVDSAHALPCASGSLADYMALGSVGCTIGSNTVADFATLSIPAAATGILASNVTVNPIQNIADFGFDFILNASANAGEFYDIRLGYTVSGLSYSGASVALSSSAVVFPGVNTAIMDVCLGAAFSGSSCAGALPPLIAYDIELDAQLLAAATFAPVNMLGVITDIGVDGGPDGSATLEVAINRFVGAGSGGGGGTGEPPSTSVPEPSTGILLALGLSLSWLVARVARQPANSRQ